MNMKSLMLAFALCVTASAASADCNPEIIAVASATEQMNSACADNSSSSTCILATQEVEIAVASLEQCIFRETQDQPIGG